MTTTRHTDRQRVIIAGVEIFAVASTRCDAAVVAGTILGAVLREPLAVIVRGPDGDRAFDLDGRPVPLPSQEETPEQGPGVSGV